MLLKYGSPAKLFNLARACWAYRRGQGSIASMPAFLKVEISRKCRVLCRQCLPEKADVFFPFDRYCELVDRLSRWLFEVSLYDIGEPLQNERAADYVRYAHQRRLGTVISSTLSVDWPVGFWDDLAHSGLDRLIVAIDGVTPEVYRQYRTNGDLSLALANLRRLVAMKRSAGLPLFIEWQMIDFPWNRHEQSAARALAAELGCDRFNLITDVWGSRQRELDEAVPRTGNCILPFLVLVVTAYGQICRCYKHFPGREHFELAMLDHQAVETVWNHPELARIRDPRQIAARPICQFCQE